MPIVGSNIISKISAAALEAIAIGSAYAVEKTRIPGKFLFTSSAVTRPSSMLTATTITTKIRVTKQAVIKRF